MRTSSSGILSPAGRFPPPPIAIAVIFLSGSRNAWLSAAVGLAALVATNLISDRRRLLGWPVAVAVALVTLALILMTSEEGRQLLLPRGASFRPDIWQAVFHEVQSRNPLFGLGILTPDQVAIGDRTFQPPHSMYLAIFFQGGWVALGCFLLLVGGSLRTLLANYQLRQAKLAISLLSLSLTSYFLDGHELIDKVGETWILFWIAIGISVGLSWSQRLRAA